VVEVPPRALWNQRILLQLNQERLEAVAKERKRSSFSCECAHTVISFINSNSICPESRLTSFHQTERTFCDLYLDRIEYPKPRVPLRTQAKSVYPGVKFAHRGTARVSYDTLFRQSPRAFASCSGLAVHGHVRLSPFQWPMSRHLLRGWALSSCAPHDPH